MKNNEKKITPLSKFPTEALVMNYRRHRVCRTRMPLSSYRTYNKITCNYDYWVPVEGKLETDKGTFDCIISYKKVSLQDLRDHFTEIKGDIWKVSNDGWFSFTDELEFNFNGMYWKGTIDEIKSEMAKRKHVPLKGKKDFRRWKMKYKKSLKN